MELRRKSREEKAMREVKEFLIEVGECDDEFQRISHSELQRRVENIVKRHASLHVVFAILHVDDTQGFAERFPNLDEQFPGAEMLTACHIIQNYLIDGRITKAKRVLEQQKLEMGDAYYGNYANHVTRMVTYMVAATERKDSYSEAWKKGLRDFLAYLRDNH